jgi:hypothetical protein
VLVKRYSIKWAHPLIGTLLYWFTLTMLFICMFGVVSDAVQILTLVLLVSEVIFSFINYNMYKRSLSKISN